LTAWQETFEKEAETLEKAVEELQEKLEGLNDKVQRQPSTRPSLGCTCYLSLQP
jgi:chaperonin cofactor prefoldin